MKKAMILFLLVIHKSLLLFSYQYDLAICAIFCEDDLPYMNEWVEFHKKQGVQHIYLYNHLANQDKIFSCLSEHLETKFIEIKDWNYSYNTVEEWNAIQQNAYMNCINQIKNSCHWCAIIDTDEFLFSPRYKDLKIALKNYNDYSGVVVNWIFYGTSNYTLSPGQKLTDYLLYREKISLGKLQGIKSIVKPKYVSGGFIHVFYYTKSYAVNENFLKIKGFDSPLSCEIFRINHYWTRDMNFFFNVKIPRRFKWYKNADNIVESEKRLNEEFDDIIKCYN